MMTPRFTHERLKQLAELDGAPCVSLYLPTRHAPPQMEQDPIRLKNMIRQATQKLVDAGIRRPKAKEMLEPASSRLKDNSFWAYQSAGLAMFLAEGFYEEYRLPLNFQEKVCLGPRFYLTPLLPLAHGNGLFHVLAISQNSCRLFRGDREELLELHVDDLPEDLRSALGWWQERQLSFHSHKTGGGTDVAMFHGHEEDEKTIEITAYFRRVVKALWPVVRDGEAPLVFAGVEEMYPLFEKVAGDLPLVSEPVTGNPDRFTGKQLHGACWKLVAPVYRKAQEKAVAEYRAKERNSRATQSLAAILPAARDGLVATLLLADDAGRQGEFDFDTGQVFLGESEHGEDIYNLAAILTLRAGGEVFPVEQSQLPEQVSAAAILRAPVKSIAVPVTHPE